MNFNNAHVSPHVFPYHLAVEFVQLYYHYFDQERYNIGPLYADNASMSWNYIDIKNRYSIQKFFIDDMPLSEHRVSTITIQQVPDACFHQTVHVININGEVRYSEQPFRPYEQFLLLIFYDGMFSICMDSYRLPPTYNNVTY